MGNSGCVCHAYSTSECACGVLWEEEAAERADRDDYHHEGGCEDVLNWLTRPYEFSDIHYQQQWRAMSWCLAANLAMGAALCRAYELGDGVDIGPGQHIELKGGGIAWIPDAIWSPGCGRRAP